MMIHAAFYIFGFITGAVALGVLVCCGIKDDFAASVEEWSEK